MRVATGLDVALESLPWGSAPIGLLTHGAARTGDGRPGRVAMQEAGAQVRRLFSPEHGLEAAELDGVAVGDGVDAPTGLPVVSLYGDRRRPRPEDLADLEGIVVDLQDVGARCYTYQSTMLLALRAAAQAGLPAWVLDRPNPITGRHAEGVVRQAEAASFVGLLPIPMRHGLTFRELATWACPPGLELSVVRLRGWAREMWWDQTGLVWTPPSPAIPDPDTALAYPGTVLLEGTTWATGRGTAAPFRVVAGPDQPISVSWEVRDTYRPVAAGIRLLERLCHERGGPSWAGRGRTLDLLYGGPGLRETLERGDAVEPLIELARFEGRRFEAATRSCHLY
ncbi:MAG: exo-beta-N-acetylmuramidase NamZ family protein [Candidatus Dormibacteraceae bacterium]